MHLSSKLKRQTACLAGKQHVACKAIKDFYRLFEAFQLALSACLGSQYMGCASLRGLSAALHEYLSCCPHYIKRNSSFTNVLMPA